LTLYFLNYNIYVYLGVELIVPKIHKIQKKESTMFGLLRNGYKKIGGFSFSRERQAELKDRREYLLGEYDYYDSWKKTKKRVIKVVDGFSDIREILAFYKIKPEDCVAILGHKGQYSGDLNEIPKLPKNLAGVFCVHEKNREVSFPDGISENTVLYNVFVSVNNSDIYYTEYNKLFSTIPTKQQLIKVLFGRTQKKQNHNVENFLLSLDIVKQDSLYFYFATKASKEVRESILNFKEKYTALKANSMRDGRYYPSVPDCTEGGSFDWGQVENDAKKGIEIKFFHGYLVYEEFAKNNPELKSILEAEKKRIEFISKFPDLEDQLFSNAFSQNFGRLCLYGYSSFDRASYGSNSGFEIRGLNDKDRDSIWSSLFDELETLYEGKKPEKYFYSVDEVKKAKTKRENVIFAKITDELISGKSSNDDDVISIVNLNSSKGIVDQIVRGATFSFVKLPVVDSQNHQVKGLMYKAAIDLFKSVMDEELKKDFVQNTAFETI